MTEATHDEYAGQGGSYVLDPETGKRTLVERTAEPTEQPSGQPADAADAPQE